VTLHPFLPDTLRRTPFTVAAALAGSLIVTACAAQNSGAGEGDATSTGPAPTRTITHSAGTTQVPASPQRIVTTTDQNALLPLLELGVVPVASAGLIGEDGAQSFRRVEGYDTSAVEFVGAYGEPNLEAIAAQRPDLVVGYEFDESYEQLSAIAPTVLVQIFGRPLTEALLDFADVVDRQPQAQVLMEEYDLGITQMKELLEPVAGDLTVSVISAGGPGEFYRADDWHSLGTVLTDLDLQRPAPQQGPNDGTAYSLEELSEHDADVVIVIDYSPEAPDPGHEALLASPLLDNLAAARADQLHVIDGTTSVGSAWGHMATFTSELERVLVTEGPDPSVVD
jgi:iron complex transport system substrate-binding protein